MKCTFPRSRIKKIVRTHTPDVKVQKKVDLLLFLDYIMFLKRLAKEAGMQAHEEKENVILPTHIAAVRKKVLKSMHG